jgi:hypothetical protein
MSTHKVGSATMKKAEIARLASLRKKRRGHRSQRVRPTGLSHCEDCSSASTLRNGHAHFA